MRIPLSAPEITEPDIEAVTRVLRGTALSLGPQLEEFECRVKEYVGASYAMAVNSGTSGLHLAMRALGIGEGDEVIVPSFAFIAAANVICYERAVPVFAEIETETLTLDPQEIEAALNPRTRAILLVHTFGYPADVSAILAIARRHHLFVIEDACEALGAEIDGRKVGPLCDVGVFAFYPNKQLTTGEGGMVVTHNKEIAAAVRSLRNQGRRDPDEWLQHAEIGYSYRLSDIHCALGAEQLKRFDAILRRREAVAESYHRKLSGHPGLILPPLSLPRRKISWFVYVVRLADCFSRRDRDWILQEMLKREIGCGRYFAPIHLQPAYRSAAFRKSDLSLTERIAERTLALPFFNQIEDRQIDEVSMTLAALLDKLRSR
ncbi:MAG: DegT/DnrJ/EryC1/StrS family aminotransferase [Acidobacteria bacterium]|nr:DegT/DnrJ/EryC1/StrS family aminotransferase [Acidobacteriota bacterium]